MSPTPCLRSGRHLLPGLVLLAVLTVLATTATPAAAQVDDTVVTTVVPTPRVPTWQDEVRLEIRGVSSCLVSVGDVAVTGLSTVPTLRVDLATSCAGQPPGQRAFSVSAQVGHLAPAAYQVRISAAGGVAISFLTVYDRADVVLRARREAAFTDALPVILDLVLYDDLLQDIVVEPRPAQGHVVIRLDRDAGGAPVPPAFADESTQAVPVSLGTLPPGEYEIRVFDVTEDGQPKAYTRTITVWDADLCVPSPTALCLNDGRFRVEVDWRDFQDRTGEGVAVPLPGRDDTGAFWFFNQNNLELTVKVLDGCGVNDHYWVFVSSGSTVEYDLLVTDTATGEERPYRNESGETPSLIPDTAAFASCP